MAQEPSVLAASPAASRAQRSLRVLVADDERDIVLTLSAILQSEGHSVYGVYKGSDVLPIIRSHKPDVCILDVDLPGPSGFALAREIKASYGDEAPLLIAISGKFMGQTDRMLGNLAGFDHYCLKPCDPQDLIALLVPSARSNEDCPDPTFGRTLIVASELLGGSEALSSHLGVSRRDLLAWMTGNVQPPIGVFLRAVDVLIDEVSHPSAEEGTARPPAVSDRSSAPKPE